MSTLKKKNIISPGTIEDDNEIISATDLSSRPADNAYLLYQADHAIYSDPVNLNKSLAASPESAAFTWQFRKNSTSQSETLQIQEDTLSAGNTAVNAAENVYKSKTISTYSSAVLIVPADGSGKISFALSSGFSGMNFNTDSAKPYVFSSALSYTDVQTASYTANPSTNQLIKFKTWEQGGPYNNLCPLDPSTGQRSVVGCVATAASQILYYWKYPKSITFSATDNYVSDGANGVINIPTDAASLKFPTFSELNSYLYNIKYDFSDQEVAALSFAVGIKFEMGYSSNESGAWVIPGPFKKDFNFISAGVLKSEYKTNAGITKKMDLSSAAVISILADNLNNGCPIFTAIRQTSTGSGHAVVIDGFRSSDNYFHFNMGWGKAPANQKEYDGWYSLNNIYYGAYDKIEALVIDLFPTGTLNQTYTVTNTNDYGAGSLRRAVEMANNKNGADTIVFDSALAGQIIKLTTGEITITDDLNIAGFASNTVTVSGGWTGSAGTGGRIFYVSDGDVSKSLNVSISGLKLTAGYSSENGGAIYNEESLALERVSVTGSKAVNGGAIDSKSSLEISNSVISGNVASGDGGGIYITSEGSLTSLNNTIVGNTAGNKGGGLDSGSSSLKLDNTIIAANNAKTNSDILGNASSSSSNNIIGNSEGTNIANGVNGNQAGTALAPLDAGFVTLPKAGADAVWGTTDDIKGDYYLKANSIAVNSGNNSAISADYEFDINGNTRVTDSTVDIGAYEYHVPDTVKPSVPDGLVDDNTAGNIILLDWNDSTDDFSGINKYQVQVDDSATFGSPERNLSVTESQAIISGLSDKSYFWRVRAQDNAGNWSDWSVQDSFIVATPDTAPPTVPSTLRQSISGASAALDWSDSYDSKSGLKQYEIQIDDSYSFNSPEQYLTSDISNLTVKFDSDGLRYWRVRAQDNTGNYSTWSVFSSFSIAIPDTLPPETPSVLKETVTGGAVLLDWNDSTDNKSGVNHYRVQVDNNADFSTPEYDSAPVVSNAYFSGLGDGTYYWRVKALDKAGNWSAWSTSGDFTIILPDIVAPSMPSGLTQSVIQGTAMLDWSDSTDDKSGVKRYEIQVDRHNDFLSPDQSTSATGSAVTVSGFADGSYFWRVRAQDNAGNYGSWSSSSNFTVLLDFVAPSIPKDLKPTAGAAGSGSVYLDWKDATDDKSGVKQYSIQIDDNSDFSSPAKTASSSISQATVTDLAAGKYYSRVRTQDKAGNFSAWSNVASFLLTPKDVAANDYKAAADIAAVDNSVGFGDASDCYKLTMTNAGLLTLTLSGLSGDANLSLLDSNGRVLKSSSNKGLANESIANLALLSGTYYVKVAAADNGKLADNIKYTLTHTEKYYPVDKAANEYKTAKDISNIDNWVGFGDAADFYKLSMTGAGALTLGLSGLSGDANLSLLDANGRVLKTSAKRGLAGEAIATNLLAGTYYVKVAGATKDVNADYTLTHAEKYCPVDTAGNSFTAASRITQGTTTAEWLGFGDKEDYYKFELAANTAVELKMTGLSSDVNLYLYDSSKRQIAASAKTGKADEAIAKTLKAGTYYVKTLLAGKDDTAYSLAFSNAITVVKIGSLQLFSSSSTGIGNSSSALDSNANDQRKNYGMLAS